MNPIDNGREARSRALTRRMWNVSFGLSHSRKGCGPTIRGMHDIDTAREARSRNLARLRKLTIGTAALGVAATSGFGWLAAMTYTGTVNAATTAYTSTVSSAAAGTTSSGSGSTANAATGATTSSSAVTAPTVTVSGTAHVASGGS
jgi:hypothetical protein